MDKRTHYVTKENCYCYNSPLLSSSTDFIDSNHDNTLQINTCSKYRDKIGYYSTKTYVSTSNFPHVFLTCFRYLFFVTFTNWNKKPTEINNTNLNYAELGSWKRQQQLQYQCIKYHSTNMDNHRSSRFKRSGSRGGNEKATKFFNLWMHSEIIFILLLVIIELLIAHLCISTAFYQPYTLYATASSYGNNYRSMYNNEDDYRGARHVEFSPPRNEKPCDHPFRDSAENCALISDIVLIGSPVNIEYAPNSLLYNAKVKVESIIKLPRHTIYPIRPGHAVKIGFFNRIPDKGKCWLHVDLHKRYIFFIEKPHWTGRCNVSQLPIEYNSRTLRHIREVLYYNSELFSYIRDQSSK